MSMLTFLINNGESGQPQNQEALVTVLGVCLLIIGLCAFAGLILLFQQLQRTNRSPEVAPAAPVLTRRTTKPTATTTQFRPLSENLRHRGDLARQLNGTSERSLGGLAAPSFTPFTTSSSPLPPAASPAGAESTPASGPPVRLLNTAPPSSIAAVAAASSPAGPSTSAALGYVALAATGPGGVMALSAPTVPSRCGSIHSGAGGCPAKSAPRPIDEIDISLLSRIDEALASGVMRPNQATQLLKSYGCDVDELLQMELADSSLDGGADLPTRLTSAPVLGTRPRATAATALVTDPSAARAAAAAAAPVVRAAAAAASTPQLKPPQPPTGAAEAALSQQQQHHHHHPPRPQVDPGLCREGSATPLMLSGRGSAATATAVGSGGSGVVIDDALLAKLDLALASGCVRPEQATQLLKSYGCDVEELLRDELGEGSPVPSRKASSGLSG
ncbi:hypothetical protein PLESTB_000431900 [Pleodorina starrii]|uniref:Uncharacterized protein n=1 Tax=Pleodorina starrii TaxID=330485 RepID=A0A9W6BEK9_9CHLO|nr:hypothetical protein PLESTM_001691600 [Pleodorina starrii]GLC50786.1 hypothetical protein PLESTB_000431900 [Pleodorina starrii]GLC77387.1 hypothetical protein PLESTF_001928300 [Pleodorina starrii]